MTEAPGPGGWFEKARKQHERRVKAVAELRREVETEIFALQEEEG